MNLAILFLILASGCWQDFAGRWHCDYVLSSPTVSEVNPAHRLKSVGTVTVDIAPHCQPCEQLKRDVKDYGGLTFLYRQGADGVVCPRLTWTVNGKRYYQEGWNGLRPFVEAYNRTVAIK